MPDFSLAFTVEPQHIDENRHLNNVVYVQWMQEIALAHSKAVYHKIAFNPSEILWVVRSHQIRYLKSAKLGDIVEIRTRISKSKGVRAWRDYVFVLKSNGIVIAEASTEWVCLDPANLKPKRIPEKLVKGFAE